VTHLEIGIPKFKWH